jgi:pyruvate carboxylase subunit B
MLKDAGFKVKDINMDAYMEARRLTQSYMDDYLGYFIDPSNKVMTSLLVGCGLPGGMMGSMMADLKGFHGAINSSLRNQGKKELQLNELVVMLFQEVEYVWPRLGYPPLVTPFSQYVKNIALMNLMHILKGEPRWSTIDKDTWNMILGKTGKLPGELAPEIIQIAKVKGMEFYTGNPQDAFPNELDKFRKEMKENNWDLGQDDEELFEFAMHERQYRDYKSGVAKQRFNQELEAAKAKAGAPIIVTRPVVEMPKVDVSVMFTVGNVANVIWDPIVGALIDKHNPKLGKYRSYLVFVGIPNHICNISYRKHHGNVNCIESIDIGIEEQQVHTCCLEDEVLCQVTRSESDALQPTQFVESLGFL